MDSTYLKRMFDHRGIGAAATWTSSIPMWLSAPIDHVLTGSAGIEDDDSCARR